MYSNNSLCYSSFVVLSDVKRISLDSLNPVIYNPLKLSHDKQIEQLKTHGKQYMNYDFNDDEINTLMSYDENHLNDFINTYRKIVGLLK